jgi:hypothetical protein
MDKITIERETLRSTLDVLTEMPPSPGKALVVSALRAALAAQPAELVAMLYDDGTWIAERTTAGRALNNRMLFAGSPKVGVYVAPPAQPADSTPSNKE